jgi:hypothetical protein
MTSSQLVAAVVVELAAIAAVVALAITHVISGGTAVALLGPHLAFRALAELRKPPPSSGASSHGQDEQTEQPRRGGRVRRLGRVLVEVALRAIDPLAEGLVLAAAGVAALELVAGGAERGANVARAAARRLAAAA